MSGAPGRPAVHEMAATARWVMIGLLLRLERAHGYGEDLRGCLERVRGALYAADDAADGSALLEAIDEARRGIDRAMSLCSPRGVEAVELALRALPGVDRLMLEAQDLAVDQELAREQGRGREAPPPRPRFRTSFGAPALHRLERSIVRVDVSSAIAPPLDDGAEELDDEADQDDGEDEDEDVDQEEGGAGVERGPADELADLERVARHCLEEIAVTSSLRQPTARHTWTIGAGYEDRLLRNLDALAALGTGPLRIDVVDRAIAYEREHFALDPGRAFARAFVLGCVEGADAADAAVVSLENAHDTTLRAQCEALTLASNPHVGVACAARVQAGGEPRLIAALLEVLRRRGEPDIAALAMLLAHPAPAVRAEAARGLAATGATAAAQQLLEDALGWTEEPTTVLACAEALAILGSRRGIAAARALLAAPPADPATVVGCARLVAIAGDASDLDGLVAAGARTPAALPALGWLGHPGGVAPLLVALERAHAEPRRPGQGRRGVEAALAAALERIAGGGPREPLVGDDRMGDADDAPATDPAPWKRHWADAAPRFDPRLRYRFGSPHTLAAMVAELESPESFADPRETCALELAVAIGPEALFDTRGWFERQTLAIAALRGRLGPDLSSQPGVYPAHRTRPAARPRRGQ